MLTLSFEFLDTHKGDCNKIIVFRKGSSKKSSFLSGRATKTGGGLNGCAALGKKVPMATKPRGGGG